MGMITSASTTASSSSGGLRQNLKNKSVMDLMRTVLCLEDKFSKHYVLHPIGSKEKPRFSYRPVLIERTWAGADIEYLLHPFVHIGQHAAVTRAGVVAPRGGICDRRTNPRASGFFLPVAWRRNSLWVNW